MTYVLCGGLGGFGLELADWLVLRGAMKLVITSRSGITTGYQGFRVQTWRGYGCTVKISTIDCSTLKGCEDLLQDAELIGPVAAIFNLAVVLRDALLENQSAKHFKEVFAPKVDVTRNLDKASRKYCRNLKHFVAFSSISCGRGNAGQTNYGMANSVMERICEARVQEGLPGLAIQWGAIGDVGLVASMQRGTNIEVGGTLPQRISSCLEVLDIFLRTSVPVVSSMVLAQKSFKSKNEMTAVEYAAKLIGVRDVRLVSAQTTLPELGMDSMMLIELKQGLERDYEIFLTPTEIRQLTFTGLELLSESRTPVNEVNFDVQTKAKEDESYQVYIHRFCSEAEAAQPVVQLPSFETSDVTPIVFLIPGIEGVSISVKPLALKLRCQIFCLQLAYQSYYKSVEEISKELLPEVKNRLNNCSTFHFIGYSFGCLVAFELTRMLESDGLRGKLCLIDGAPGLYKQLAQNESEVQDLQINILTYLQPVVPSEIKALLRKEPTWSQKLEVILKESVSAFPFSKDLMALIFNSTYFRVLAAKNYDPDHKTLLKSHVTLIRPTRTNYMGKTEQDYSLSTWTETRVPVQFIEANHVTVVDTEQCADIINKLFVEDLN